jgi:hypothetical protein
METVDFRLSTALNELMKYVARIALLFAIVGIAQWSGCSNGGPETIPVYGKVSFPGREFPKFCRLYFHPVQAELSRPSMATPEPDGSYEAKSFPNSDGLLPGTYSVKVSYFDLKPGADPNSETGYAESAFDAGELVVGLDAGEIEHNVEVPAKSAGADR